jgi:hypothetical protein
MQCRIDLRCSIPARLYRLDARLGLRPDVPDALLRFLAKSQRTSKQILHVLAARRNFSCSAVFISGGYLVCIGYGIVMEEESKLISDRHGHDPPRRRNFRIRVALSPAGISHRLGLGTGQRPAARGCAQYDWRFHDADGHLVLGGVIDSPRITTSARARACLICNGCADFPFHPAALDHLASGLAAVADRVLHQRRAQSRSASGWSLPDFSLDSFRLRRARHGIYSPK